MRTNVTGTISGAHDALVLAGEFFDTEIAPGHRASGVPAEVVASLRLKHGRDCLASPGALRDLTEWAKARDVGGDR
jgi:hypothetical protein